MGTWGVGLFENDTAADFSYEILEGGWPLVREVLDEAGPLHWHEIALVCAELLTWALGRGRHDGYGALPAFIEVHGKEGATPALRKKAVRLLSQMERTNYRWSSRRDASNYIGLIAGIRTRLEGGLDMTPARRRGGRPARTIKRSRRS